MPRITIGPKKGGGWEATGARRSQEFRTQAEAETAARAELLATGGGELAVKGRSGRVRSQNTVGRKDPRGSKG